MTDDSYELSARDYLLKSAEGEKFEYVDLHMGEQDDGPFGGDRYEPLEYLNLHIPDEVVKNEGMAQAFKDLGVPVPNQLLNLPGRVLRLELEVRDEMFRQGSVTFSWAEALVVATPRDPRGPFTVSVYQDWTLVGWLGGPDIEDFAIELVENFDFGCAIVPADEFEEVDGKLVLNYYLGLPLDHLTVMRMPDEIISPEPTVPSKLEWAFEPAVIYFPRNVSWDGKGCLDVPTTNEVLTADLDHPQDYSGVSEPYITLIPDVWNKESGAVFVYMHDEYVGRMSDKEAEARFFAALCGAEHKIGLIGRPCALYRDAETQTCGLEMDADCRDIIRIDWDVVEQDL